MTLDEIEKILLREKVYDLFQDENRVFSLIFKCYPQIYFIDYKVSDTQSIYRSLINEFGFISLTLYIKHQTINKENYGTVRNYVCYNYDKGLLITKNYDTVQIFTCKKTDLKYFLNILKCIKKYKKVERKKRPQGNIFMLSYKGKKLAPDFIPFKLGKINVSIEKNYNDDFVNVDKIIQEKLNEKNQNGIAILHGLAGCGKTYYLRYLCNVLKKKILYIPPSMVDYIVNPAFIQLLKKHSNSILLIEDADNVLRSRDKFSDMQSVSSILNIADGMLKDVLQLQVIATFNTNIINVDDAILRKGRLIAQYEFKKLKANKAQVLSKELGFDTIIKENMTLADIYNQDAAHIITAKKVIGFN